MENDRPVRPPRPRFRPPTPVLPRTEQAVEEGLLIARSALTLEVKNHVIVRVLRDDQCFHEPEIAQFVVETLHDLAEQQIAYAARTESAAVVAKTAKGSARHQHDYRAPDLPALEQRSAVYRALATELLRLGRDADVVAEIVETARLNAWSEVSHAIELRLDAEQSYPAELDYDNYREERLAVFLALDFSSLRPVGPRARKYRPSSW